MTRSPAETKPKPKPVPVRRYRYSKLRWRILVHAFDAAGSVAIRPWRRLRPAPTVDDPRRILVVQLDHLGDAVLTSPLLARLRAAYPDAAIDVLASPSNREVFEADPNVARVRLAARSWFERDRGRWALGSAVWGLGRSLRGAGYDLGIDVRGDILTVMVLALAGIPRRVGWAMGGGGFLLTDVAGWVPGRHEVASRLALLRRMGLPTDGPSRVAVHATDRDRAVVARWLRMAWPARGSAHEPAGRIWSPPPSWGRERVGGKPGPGANPPHPDPPPRGGEGEVRTSAPDRWAGRAAGVSSSRPRRDGPRSRGLEDETPAARRLEFTTAMISEAADRLHAGRFGGTPPLLAVHLAAGTAAKRWPSGHWNTLIGRFLADGWRVVVVGGPDDADLASGLDPHADLRDWTGRMTVPQTTAFLERADLFIGSDSGPSHLAACAGTTSVVLFSGTNLSRQWRPWSRRSLVLRHPVALPPVPSEGLPAGRPPLHVGHRPRPRLPRRPPMVGPPPSRGIAACPDLTSGEIGPRIPGPAARSTGAAG